ncbi:hypothetical protein [Pedobacter sp. JY14-1]|uniref:hypothetical protein n=1 Tax=Pedobacter sp. JY14-1 TaxID=3034151 RepID=UPI0023E2C85F|nr:hypothetical protein [Pedobacter sp. JY14-1]
MRNLIISALVFMSSICLAQNSKIVLSSRWFHPRNSNDTLSTLKVTKEFEVERLDWLYCDDTDKLNELSNLGIPFSLAINPQVTDSFGYSSLKMRMVNLYGKPIIAPWMRAWKISNPYWGCVNNVQFQELFLKASERMVDMGAYGIMVDDARFNDHAVEWGGCYCTFCLRAFNLFLVKRGVSFKRGFDYRDFKLSLNQSNDKYFKYFKEFQRESVIAFLKKWKEALKTYSANVVLLTNNFGGQWTDIYKVFDAGIAEFAESSANYDQVDTAIKNSNLLKKRQIFSYASRNEGKTLGFYLYSYFNNVEALIPWDTFLVSESTMDVKRFFINSDRMIPIVKFVKSTRDLLNGATNVSNSSLGIVAEANTRIRCYHLADGSLYLLAVIDLQSNVSKIKVTVPSQLVNQNSDIFKNTTKKMQGSMVTYEGDLILLKLT